MIVSTLLALSFAPPAEAANTPKIKNIRVREVVGYSVAATTSGSDTSVASIVAEVESDAGDESVTLVESDAWLHGAAALPALPKTEATVTLDVYDASNALLTSFTGTISASGAFTRMKRGDICGSGDPTTCSDGKLDLDVLAVDTFNAAKGYEAAFDLVGADTYTVAYATLVVTEGKTSTKAELDWDDVGAVWEGDLGDAPEGLVAVKATTYDSRGKKLDSAKVEVAAPWADGGAGVPALPTDEDPYTSLTVRDVKELADILENTYGIEPAALTVVSDGWNAGGTLPVDASVELTNGTTLNVPVNSYQITSLTTLSADFSEAVDTWFAKGGSSVTVTVEGGLDLLVIDSSGSISNDDYVREPAFGISGVGSGAAVVLTGAAFGDWELSASAFATTASGLPTRLPLTVSLLDQKGNVIFTEDVDPTFDEEVSVVFGYAMELAEDPIGLDVSGKVSLLGEANRTGKQETLSKGKFYGSFTRNDDGDLGLAGADKDAVSPRGDILIGGEPIGFELTDTNKDGVITGPPAIVFRTTGNGKGTRAATTASSGNPGLL